MHYDLPNEHVGSIYKICFKHHKQLLLLYSLIRILKCFVKHLKVLYNCKLKESKKLIGAFNEEMENMKKRIRQLVHEFPPL